MTTMTSGPEAPLSGEHPDEVKRLEKAYDLAKELFNFSENVTKTIDEKSRNSVTTASAIAAFAFLVRKPENLGTLPETVKMFIWLMAGLVGIVYALHFLIVRPQKTKTVNPDQLSDILNETTWPEEVAYYNFQTLTAMYRANLEVNRFKARWLSWQNVALALTLLAALAYLAFGNPTPNNNVDQSVSTPATTNLPVANGTTSETPPLTEIREPTVPPTPLRKTP